MQSNCQSFSRRSFLAASAVGLGTAAKSPAQPAAPKDQGFQYDSLKWIDEQDDPSLTLETENLIAKVIDNTGLKVRPSQRPVDREPEYSHALGYHAIRSLWHKTERRNIVAPFVSWLNLQAIQVEGLKLDPIDSRARYGVARGWPIRMEQDGKAVVLKLARMPVSGIEYSLRLQPGGANAIDFEAAFTLHEKTAAKAKFYASWPCYLSTYGEVELHAPTGDPAKPDWKAFGEKQDFVVGETVNYAHSQRTFRPSGPLAFPAVYGRIGTRVLAIMVSRPEVKFFIVNAGGHRSYFPVQNPAWDFAFELPDYEKGKPFGFRGRLIYQSWTGAEDLTARYHQWVEASGS